MHNILKTKIVFIIIYFLLFLYALLLDIAIQITDEKNCLGESLEKKLKSKSASTRQTRRTNDGSNEWMND